jgi:hypothetical protein
MPQLATNAQSEERPELRVVSDFSHIPAPSEVTWLGEWHPFECDCCGDEDWQRYFTRRSWTVETSFPEPIEVHIAGSQYSDASTDMWICLDGETHDLNAEDALMLAASLSWAAEELERIHVGSA